MIRQTIDRKRGLLLALTAGFMVFAGVGSYGGSAAVTAQTQPEICSDGVDNDGDSIVDECVLILDTTVTGDPNDFFSPEALEAAALGFVVDLDTPTEWGSKTTADFAKYRAIILGDPTDPETEDCTTNTGPIAAAEANRATWTPAITGGVVVIATDPVAGNHPGDGGHSEGKKLIGNSIAFAASAAGQTGAVIVLSCYYNGVAAGTQVPVLEGFGNFTIAGEFAQDAHITDTGHPVVTTPVLITDADLSDWGSSVHAVFDPVSMPSTFTEVAESTSSGMPYIIARGRQQSYTATFTDGDTTELFVRDPSNPEDVFARLTFADVLTTFHVRFTFTTVSKAAESALLDPTVFGPGAQCLSYDSDAAHCVRHTVRLVDEDGNDLGVPLQDVHFDGNFRLELGFHSEDVIEGNIGTPILAQRIKHDPLQVEVPLDLYDRDILTSFRFNSCNCVGSGETDGFSDFVLGEVILPTGEEDNDFIGPLPPIKSAAPFSVLKAGRALPLKFRLLDENGIAIIDGLRASIEIWRIAATVSGSVEVSTDERGAATGTEFAYNVATDQWELTIDTKGWPSGDYVGIIRSLYVPAESIVPRFSPQKFNFSVK